MQSATEIAAAVRGKSLSPVELVELCLKRIELLEPELMAWVELDSEGALRQARELADALARGADAGPLAGVPVGIKDIVDVAGLPTRAGAPAFAHYTPDKDATTVARLRQAGAIIVGKTHTTTFAYLDPAPTRNPWDRGHTPGGSSSGSGAAVGAGSLPLAIGSQTVGSVLRPAGYCGCVGFKPSFGRISYAGTLPLAPSFDHLGVICSSVADAALALHAIAGHDASDAFSQDAPVEDYAGGLAHRGAPRLGVPRNYYQDSASEQTSEHLEDVIQRFLAAGADVVDVAFPSTAPEISDAAQPVMRLEAAIAHSARFAEHKDEYPRNLRGLVEAGLATSSEDYAAARDSVHRLRLSLEALLGSVDALLLPTAPDVAPVGLESTGPGIFCGPASFTGLPSISLPSGLAASGLPFSIQLVGPHLRESALLNDAAWAESVLDFQARPDLPA